jgi:hypothetical protein
MKRMTEQQREQARREAQQGIDAYVASLDEQQRAAMPKPLTMMDTLQLHSYRLLGCADLFLCDGGLPDQIIADAELEVLAYVQRRGDKKSNFDLAALIEAARNSRAIFGKAIRTIELIRDRPLTEESERENAAKILLDFVKQHHPDLPHERRHTEAIKKQNWKRFWPWIMRHEIRFLRLQWGLLEKKAKQIVAGRWGLSVDALTKRLKRAPEV